MKVTVFGIGYVGLVQAAVLAEVGHDVMCIDVDENKVENLKQGIIPIFEPGLTPLVKKNYEEGRLHFSTNAKEGVEHGVMQFIAVGTPPDEDGSADLKYVTAVARTIAEHMTGHKVVLDKSTVPVGTADTVRRVMAETLKARGCDAAFDVVSSAELTKYAANCMLATKISFMNEISNLAERLGADIEKVRQGIGSDSRIGYHFIYPGCGYGGSCFPKDVQALIRTSEQIGYVPRILKAVEEVNQDQKLKLPEFITRHFGQDLKGKTLALWGLSFKPNTDDMREASSRVLMEELWKRGAVVQAYDPEAMDETQRIYGHRDDLRLMGTKEAALQGADALVICTEWQAFRAPDFDLIKKALKQPVIFDGRNLYDPIRLNKRGFVYYAIGRGASINIAV